MREYTIKQDEDGDWYVHWMDDRGRHNVMGFHTEEEAEKYAEGAEDHP